MHPVFPLHLELAWTDRDERVWDSDDGKNHQYEFDMIVRGWDSFLAPASAPTHTAAWGSWIPQPDVQLLPLRRTHELGRPLESWNLGAYGNKVHQNSFERFLAVDYMDLHILKGTSGIGLHRHRDNQEVFLLMQGQGLMVVGDWADANRERCFEVRTLAPATSPCSRAAICTASPTWPPKT